MMDVVHHVFGAQDGRVDSPVTDTSAESVKVLISRLDLELYKATIKSLTQFGDRHEGTERNKKA